MRKCQDIQRRKPTPQEVDTALAMLLANTKRARRPHSLLKVSEWLKTASAGLDGLSGVAERIGVSEQMLRDFSAVQRLTPEVRGLVEKRVIDSVDTCCRIARLPRADQGEVAQAVASRRLDGDDVRGVLALRRAVPNATIGEIIRRVETARDIKEYLAEFVVPPGLVSAETLRSAFASVLGQDNVRSLRFEGGIGVLAMTSEGRRRLQDAARRKRLTKRELVEHIVGGIR